MLRDAPEVVNSKHMWRGDDTFTSTIGISKPVDFYAMEKTLIGPTEVNILKNFTGNDMFTRDNFSEGFTVKINCVAENQQNRMPIPHHKEVRLDFKGTHSWYLEPLDAHCRKTEQGIATVGRDQEVASRLFATMNQLRNVEELGLAMKYTAQRMGIGHDLRHLFTKLVLYLYDYNLSVVSKTKEKEMSDAFAPRYYHDLSDEGRMEVMRSHDIVVDAHNFTSQQLGLLSLGAAEYPSMWFAGDNMYNKCQMEADSLAIVSSESVEADESYAWRSPTDLYRAICQIACKMGAVGDLATVLRDMRGRCKMMADMLPYTKSNVVVSNMPLSYSMDLALGDTSSTPKSIISKEGGYFATSQSLVHDLMVGMCYEASATTVVEALGAIGPYFGSSDPENNAVLNGLMRDHGLKYMDETKNVLLKNWRCVAGVGVNWGFGKMLKEYVTGLAARMFNDPEGGDVQIPQLFLMLPFTYSVDSAWGMLKNWDGQGSMLLDEKQERVLKMQKTAAFTWAMGIRPSRPRVFANYSGSSALSMSADETAMLAVADGTYNITHVAMSLIGKFGARIDASEESCVAFFKSEFLHTKCSLVYDVDNKWQHPIAVAAKVFEDDYTRRRSMLGRTIAGDRHQAAVKAKAGESRIIPKAVPAPPQQESTIAKLRMLNKHPRLQVEKKPVHAKETDEGVDVVASYMVNGEERNEHITRNDGSIRRGDRVHLETVDTKGDGRCGLHAIVNDLRIHGLCEATEADRLLDRIDDASGRTTWHEMEELAGVAKHLGMGLDIYLPHEQGGYSISRYGEGEHYISAVLENGHYSAAIVRPDSRGEDIRAMNINNIPQIDEAMVDTLFRVPSNDR